MLSMAYDFNVSIAFNAALVVFAVMMICHETGRVIPDTPSKEDCRDGLETAIKALAELDHGNKMIERCHDYLERLFVATTTLSTCEAKVENMPSSVLTTNDCASSCVRRSYRRAWIQIFDQWR